jgi:D-3-phosphoglycerate dehydrogenase
MIIITAKVHPYLIETLQSKAHPFLYVPEIDEAGLLAIIKDATGLIVTTRLTIGKNMIDHAPNLKWIGRLGSGMEMIDTGYAAQKNIACYSSPEGNCQAVGEHALGMLLSILNNLHTSCKEVNHGIWKREENRGAELFGRVVGIIGYGHTGPAFANLLKAFQCRILVYDPFKEIVPDPQIEAANLSAICSEASVISFHVPLSDTTVHIANSGFFDALKQKPIIINTSRGDIIDTGALIAALQKNRISGAALDVLENEKMGTLTDDEQERFNTLIRLPNVMITPHIAGYTHEAFLKMSKVLLQKIGI